MMAEVPSDEKPTAQDRSVFLFCLFVVCPWPKDGQRIIPVFTQGHIVQVKLRDGVVCPASPHRWTHLVLQIYEGLCHSISVEDFSLILLHARLKQSKVAQP